MTETDFTRQNRDDNSVIEDEIASNDTDINAISDGRRRSVFSTKHTTKVKFLNIVSKFNINNIDFIRTKRGFQEEIKQGFHCTNQEIFSSLGISLVNNGKCN